MRYTTLSLLALCFMLSSCASEPNAPLNTPDDPSKAPQEPSRYPGTTRDKGTGTINPNAVPYGHPGLPKWNKGEMGQNP